MKAYLIKFSAPFLNTHTAYIMADSQAQARRTFRVYMNKLGNTAFTIEEMTRVLSKKNLVFINWFAKYE
jgi:hypothetical protein